MIVNRKTYLLEWKREEEESAETRRECECKWKGNRAKRRSLVNYIQIGTMISCLLKQNPQAVVLVSDAHNSEVLSELVKN